jgi:diguanylate cyclase (GGDEF)-like protein
MVGKMLSETSRAGVSGASLALKQAAFSRSPTARIIGIGGAVVILLGLAATMVAIPGEASIELLLVVPVAAAAWFGGSWPGRSVAVLGAIAQAAVVYVASGSVNGEVLAGVLVSLGVLLAIASVVPPLRFSAQSYREHAQVDPLTNLGNRRFFREVATVELNRSKRYTRPVSLICLDADGFERVRHTIGGADSDLLLVQLASVMTGVLRTSDVVARISGAEFAVLLPETDGKGARVVAEKLRRRLTEICETAGHSLTFRASVVGFGDGPVSAEVMFRQADEAMVEAKRTPDTLLAYRDYEHPPLQLV